MFHFFRNRSKRLAAAVQHVLDPKPTLHSLLTPDGATLAAELKARPLEAVQLLDSFGNLMVLAKAAVPHVAEAIEAEMDEEVAKLRRRTKEGVGTEGQQFSESAAAPDAVLAVNLVSTPQWEHWVRYGCLNVCFVSAHGISHTDCFGTVATAACMQKTRLINALIETLPSEDMQNTQDSAALKLRCECRTSDDATGLIAGLEVRASGPQVGAVMEAGPEADDASKMLFFLMFSDKPESALQTELAAAVWNAAQLTPGAEGASFFCTLGQKPAAESPQGGPETSETAAETDWIELHGSGEELLSLVMVMATLEAGELPGVGGSSGGVGRWVPADGRIQLRRQETPSKRLKTATYLVRVGDSDGGEGVVRQFSHREALALVDCLDAFCQLSPAFGLPEPRAHVGSVSVWQRAVNLLPF